MATKAQSSIQRDSFFNFGVRWGSVNATPRPLYPQERDPVPTVQEVGWASGSVWTGAENLAPHQDRPDSCESLNRLSYTGSRLYLIVLQLIIILMMQFSPTSCYFLLPRPKHHLWLSKNTFHAHIKQAKL